MNKLHVTTKKLLSAFVFIAIANFIDAGVKQNPNPNTLWIEKFNDDTSVKLWRAVLKPVIVDGCLQVNPNSGDGKSHTMGRYMTWNKKYPYFQIDLSKITELKGYKGWVVSNSSTGGGAFCNIGGGAFAGLWTFNIFDFLSLTGEKGMFFLRMDMHGYIFNYNSFKMLSKPVNALLISGIDDKKVLTSGDTIKFNLSLTNPAKDVTVTILTAYIPNPLNKITKSGYVQLTSDDKGKNWYGKLPITKNGFNGKNYKKGTLIFQSNILGGKVKKLYTTNPVEINTKGL